MKKTAGTGSGTHCFVYVQEQVDRTTNWKQAVFWLIPVDNNRAVVASDRKKSSYDRRMRPQICEIYLVQGLGDRDWKTRQGGCRRDRRILTWMLKVLHGQRKLDRGIKEVPFEILFCSPAVHAEHLQQEGDSIVGRKGKFTLDHRQKKDSGNSIS